MPAILANANQFLLNSDYPLDKIAGSYQGSLTAPVSPLTSATIAHGLGYRPLYFVKWSTDPSFSTSNDEIGTSSVDNTSFSVQMDGTNIYINVANNTAGTLIFYYRIVFFMPPDINLDIPSTVSTLDNFQLNTDYNYPKLLVDDKTAGNSATIVHNLGYYPQVEVWYVRSSDGKLIHQIPTDATGGNSTPRCQVTTSNIVLTDPGNKVSYWYYRIYVDAN